MVHLTTRSSHKLDISVYQIEGSTRECRQFFVESCHHGYQCRWSEIVFTPRGKVYSRQLSQLDVGLFLNAMQLATTFAINARLTGKLLGLFLSVFVEGT